MLWIPRRNARTYFVDRILKDTPLGNAEQIRACDQFESYQNSGIDHTDETACHRRPRESIAQVA